MTGYFLLSTVEVHSTLPPLLPKKSGFVAEVGDTRPCSWRILLWRAVFGLDFEVIWVDSRQHQKASIQG